MANDIALSVILPVYNGAGTLDQQLEALAAQELGRPWELIVADNGSTDESQDVAISWKSRMPCLRLVDA
ncbi:MAG TPA: glycosyltransferase, partial [Actinomycetota bacterium]